jgi:hypothetical protein
MVRTIVIPRDSHIQLDIPEEYVGKEIEVTYLALDELGIKPKKSKMGDFLGIISDETAKNLHDHVEKVRNEWDRGI